MLWVYWGGGLTAVGLLGAVRLPWEADRMLWGLSECPGSDEEADDYMD